MNQDSYSLPEWLQISVAIATIISSLAVIAYFTQIFISIKQFKKGLTISTNQFNLSERQSKLINQGYISPEFEVGLYNPNLVGVKMSPSMTWNNVTVNVAMTNTGNIPVIFEIISFELQFNNITKYKLPKEYKGKGTVYPKQKSVFGLANFPLDERGLAISIAEIKALNITCSILIEYQDFNDNRLKQIKRILKLHTDGTQIVATYTSIEDSV